MPVEVLTDAFVKINTVDLSDHVEEVRLTYSKEIHVATRMGAAGVQRLAGLADWEVTLTFFQDFDSAKVEATLFPLVGVQTAVAIRKSKTDAISATNPEYQGNGMLDGLPIVGGRVGQPHQTSVTFRESDGVALVRDVTP